MRIKTVLAAGFAVVALSACGGSSGNSTANSSPASGGDTSGQLTQPDASIDACKLLTSADAEGVIGSPVTQVSQGPIACSYAGQTVGAIGCDATTVAVFNAVRKATVATGGTIESASGIGDEAYFVVPKDGKDVKLYVRKGTKAFDIGIPAAASGGQSYAARKSAAQRLGIQAAGRL